MPIHKGVQISVISQWELSIHPEFPHPETSEHKKEFEEKKKRSIPTTALSESLVHSSVSVYIPSVKGARFWLRYSVLEPQAQECKLWYFKLYMNGRHISSWGIDTKQDTSGQVMRGLFEPSSRWNFKEKGRLYKRKGTESRPFFFSNQGEAQSAAIDGGSIMVIVYRAKGRRRRIAEIEGFKNQDKYGITMPSGGLIDKPQDVKYYDYHLLDARDEPYAVFRIHYRSWTFLEALNLIPPRHPQVLLPTTASIISLNRNPDLREDLEPDHDWETIDTETPSNLASPESNQGSPTSTPFIADVIGDSPKLAKANIEKESASPAKLRPSSMEINPLRLNPAKRSSVVIRSRHRSSSSELEDPFWVGESVRPLPQIPTSRRLSRQPDDSGSPVRRLSRRSSAASHAPSIAPSLLSYADRESTNSPELVINIAAAVAVLSPTAMVFERPSANNSFESSANDPSPPTPPPKDDVVEPIILTPNVTIRKHRRSVNKNPRAWSGSIHAAISPTESEWMARTPSPAPKQSTESVDVADVNKPKAPQKQKEKYKERKMKLMNSWKENKNKVLHSHRRTDSASERDDEEVKSRRGNWI
ncbi:hypothetical protein PVAG01_08104 [Phlyctema vagabunda]|uniref:DUF7918 domain-containing protein n=1 Tax=Phlyctema vagabunda TaxID=108571 RepID=A0ABR4P8G0_9HELO